MLNFLTSVIPAEAGIHFLDLANFNLMLAAPLPNPSPACERGAKIDSRFRRNDGV